jgi:DNA polymerase IV (DinB-like DNA polymerase)
VATGDSETKRQRERALAEDVSQRAAQKDALYQTIGIKVVTPPFEVNTRAESLPGPVADADLVVEVALDLLAEFSDSEVRKLGVRVSNLSFSGGDQVTLDGFEAMDDSRDSPTNPSAIEENRTLTEFESEPESTPDEQSGQLSLGDFE